MLFIASWILLNSKTYRIKKDLEMKKWNIFDAVFEFVKSLTTPFNEQQSVDGLKKGGIAKLLMFSNRVSTSSWVDKIEQWFPYSCFKRKCYTCLEKSNNRNEKDCTSVQERIFKVEKRVFAVNMLYMFVTTVISKLVKFTWVFVIDISVSLMLQYFTAMLYQRICSIKFWYFVNSFWLFDRTLQGNDCHGNQKCPSFFFCAWNRIFCGQFFSNVLTEKLKVFAGRIYPTNSKQKDVKPLRKDFCFPSNHKLSS